MVDAGIITPDVAPVYDTVFVISQSSYYDNVLTKVEDLKPGDEYTDSNYPGWVMLKAIVPGETQSVSRFRETAYDEFAANQKIGGGRVWPRTEFLIYHFANGVLPGHAPPGSVRSITSDTDPETAAILSSVFATPQPPAEQPQVAAPTPEV